MLKIFSWVTKDTNIDFMKVRKAAYAFSATLIALSIISIVVKGLYYGIDISVVILMEIKRESPIDLEDLR